MLSCVFLILPVWSLARIIYNILFYAENRERAKGTSEEANTRQTPFYQGFKSSYAAQGWTIVSPNGELRNKQKHWRLVRIALM